MQEKIDDKEKIKHNPEELKENIEKLLQEILEKSDDNTYEEECVLDEANSRIEKGSEDFQKEIAENGILNSLGDKLKRNKLLRAALVGFSLYSASPALASGINEAFNKLSVGIESAEASQDKKSDLAGILSEFNISSAHKKELEQVYGNASIEARKIILNELESDAGLDNESVVGVNDHEDSNLLVLQQQAIDLQNSGEMGSHREGGVILPFDSEHSGKTEGVEYTNNNIAEDSGKQKITIGNASKNQIRAWIDYLKNIAK
jgi:hypothetical protein